MGGPDPMTLVALGIALLGLLIGGYLVLSGTRKGERAADREPADEAQALPPPSSARIAEFQRRRGRESFVPQTVDGDEPVGAERSHFAGRPWLPAGQEWPHCDHCARPLQLFLELDLDALPAGAPPQRSGGLAQLFYCTNETTECEFAAEAWAPFAKSHRARVVDPSLPGAIAERDLATAPFPAKRIVGWNERLDLPGHQELHELGEVGPDGELDPAIEQHLEEHELPVSGDKLGGWPFWVQGVEYPACPECDGPMELLFQIDSEDLLPYMFGDAGVGHLTRCPTHSTVLAFAWACY